MLQTTLPDQLGGKWERGWVLGGRGSTYPRPGGKPRCTASENYPNKSPQKCFFRWSVPINQQKTGYEHIFFWRKVLGEKKFSFQGGRTPRRPGGGDGGGLFGPPSVCSKTALIWRLIIRKGDQSEKVPKSRHPLNDLFRRPIAMGKLSTTAACRECFTHILGGGWSKTYSRA